MSRLVNGVDYQPSDNLSVRQVNTKYGALRGIYMSFTPNKQSHPSLSSTFNSITLATIEAYLGVPYATPPVGSLRFMPPVTPTHWRGIRLANRLSPVCPQRIPLSALVMNNSTEALKRMPLQRFEFMRKMIPQLINQSEDCLYLNIYTPIVDPIQDTIQSDYSPPKSRGVPVIVFIHGESYDWNSGNVYDGSILASFGRVVVVTLNYRLGVLGFLPALVDGTVRGNYGLMDQVAALHWIQENIAEFGGQPNNVTIIGHGYGAACAHLLMLSPMAKGLFLRVILMSGSALTPWAIARDADLYAKTIAQELDCPVHDNAVMVDCLRQKRIDELFSADYSVPDHLTAFGPIIDGIVVPAEPRYLMQTESTDTRSTIHLAHSTDLLIGVTRVEAPPVFNSHEERHGIDGIRRDRILRTLIRNLFDFHQQAILLTLINEYTDWTRPVEHPINLLDSLLDIMSDALVVAPVVETSDLHSRPVLPTRPYHRQSSSTRPQQSRGRSYFYVFVHQSDEGTKFHQRLGCSHGEELAYMFGAPLAQHLTDKSMPQFTQNYSRAEVSLSEGLMAYWINFVKYGDPNLWPTELDATGDRTKGRFESVLWPQYEPTQRKYLMLGLKPKVKDHYHSHRLSFWLNLIPRLHNAGEEQIYLRHHLLTDHENMASYDGIVRQLAFKFFAPIPTNKPVTDLIATNNSIISKSRKQYLMTTSNDVNVNDGAGDQLVNNSPVLTNDKVLDNNNNNHTMTATDVIAMTDKINLNNKSNDDNNNNNNTIALTANYSTALLVTIAIGCSLLILNMLIFAGVYYQLDKNSSLRHKDKNNRNSISSNTSNNNNIRNSRGVGGDHHQSYHYNDKPQEMVVLATPEKRLLAQKSPNLSHNHVEIVNTNFITDMVVGGDHSMDAKSSNTHRSTDTIVYNHKSSSFGHHFEHSHHSHTHSSPVPSCLSNSDNNTATTTTASIIHVPISYDKSSNDNFAPEIRV
ncbi:neuroligin-4, X-linked-like isoform X2 [Oppia nitens]|uniref:neuroligin-4, X-linked-like isoform X2 n=1 Tax=Oppia nitens TaxID=1686743 RepID=UPI0023DC5CD8|nr:neuroligin-4, X-linked-like isoform X2 [Oppia nitens]